MNQDLKKLREDIESCQKCNGALLAVKNYPFKNGFKWVPAHTRVMFVAQDPPESGRYIYDGTNERFAKGFLRLLKAAGLIENIELQDFVNAGFYLTDILKCPNGKVEHCKNFLIREIQLLNPEVICTLGKKAVSAFLKRKNFKIEEYVGNFILPLELDYQVSLGKPVFCCYFPMKYPVSDKVKIDHFRKLSLYLKDKISKESNIV